MTSTREQRIANDNLRLNKVRENDRRTISNIYEECNFLVKTYTAKYAQQQGLDIEEAYQEAFMAFYQNTISLKLQTMTVEFKDYVSQIMNFKILDQLYKLDPEKRKWLQNTVSADIIEGEHIIRHVNYSSDLADEPNDYNDITAGTHKTNPLATGTYDYEKDRKETIVRQVVKLLTEPCKTILEMRYYKKMSFEDMLGKVVGFSSINTLRNKRQRCIESLESMLKLKLSTNNISQY
jgi:RNA polymerase sigma factor (sigma-70 family)